MHGPISKPMNAGRTEDAARITATPGQILFLTLISGGLIGFCLLWSSAGGVILLLSQAAFLVVVAWRCLIILVGRRASAPPSAEPVTLPQYSVVVALYDEAAVLPHLVERLASIDYPPSLLDGYLVLEAHDRATIEAADALVLPDWLRVLIAPPGTPATKPRALNHALSVARGELLTVYDAEDDPDPLQLREAAARFAADDGELVCLQAPLRIRRRHKQQRASPFLDRQFAAEYAALFEITLPAMARMGLPFPLGGTSNHFRVAALRALGGWDAWNVTEDADLGFRIWRRGWRLGTLTRPTYETPPGHLVHWLPQRTRWLKGYMQTLCVHTRTGSGMGWRGWIALTFTISAALASAAIHALVVAWTGMFFLMALLARHLPQVPWFGLGILFCGTVVALLAAVLGARRAGTPFTMSDMIAAPFYWSLLSLAFVHAFVRLILEPHRWDKTAHRPDVAYEGTAPILAPLVANAGRAAA